MIRRILICTLPLPLLLAGLAWAQAGKTAGGAVILDSSGTFWRWISVSRPALLVAEPGAAKRTTLDKKTLDAQAAAHVTPEVPEKWNEPAFDDTLWPRTTIGRMANTAFLTDDGGVAGLTGKDANQAMFSAGLLTLRGKFAVTDPATVASLTLSVKYRGGVVVYLNGREVARGGLPAGPVTAATPGDAYPPEAYVDASGKLLDPQRIRAADKELTGRLASRNRSLGPVQIPADHLRKGTNVLAIELHRSDYDPSAKALLNDEGSAVWTPLALLDVNLTAQGSGIEPNAKRPTGLQIWNQDCNDRTTVTDYGDPTEALGPIILAGTRNGTFSGKVVVSSDGPIERLQAAAGELKQADGKGAIPASALHVGYSQAVTPTPRDTWTEPHTWLEPLSETAPDKVMPVQGKSPGGAVAGVWVTARVPADAAPGDYSGSLAVSTASGKLADVPVKLHVADWALPDPQHFRTFVGIVQSPAALALNYKIDEWSERHWQLIDHSLALLGEVGNQMADIPVVEQTRLGNDEGMVHWIKKADGPANTDMAFDYDFTIVDRYLDMVQKHLGTPKFVVLDIYHGGGWKPVGAKQENTVTVVDAATGKHEHLQVPEFGTEAGKKFWTPVLSGLKERLAKRGMAKALCLGSLAEIAPPPAVDKMFRDILGDVQWLQITHPAHGDMNKPNVPLPSGGWINYHIFTYLPTLPNSEAPLPTLYNGHWPLVAYYRRASESNPAPIVLRMFGPHTLFVRLPGVSHLGLDFWPVPGAHGGHTNMYGRWQRDLGYPGGLGPAYLTWPGPNGAEPLTGFLAFHEGIQQAEAMIVISQAIDKDAEKLGADLTARCRTALKDALVFCDSRAPIKYQYTFYQVNHYGWQELSGRLFALAGDVAARTAAK